MIDLRDGAPCIVSQIRSPVQGGNARCLSAVPINNGVFKGRLPLMTNCWRKYNIAIAIYRYGAANWVLNREDA